VTFRPKSVFIGTFAVAINWFPHVAFVLSLRLKHYSSAGLRRPSALNGIRSPTLMLRATSLPTAIFVEWRKNQAHGHAVRAIPCPPSIENIPIRGHPATHLEHDAQIKHCADLAGISGFPVPSYGLGVVPGHPAALSVQVAQIEHGVGVAGVSGFPVPDERLGDAQAASYREPNLKNIAGALPASAALWYHSRALP